jgi:multiple sugar transport system substrate-binding protein
MNRRSFLARAARGAAVAGGLAGILAGGAPARASRARLHVLRQVDVVPEADAELRLMAPQVGRLLGTEIEIEFVAGLDGRRRLEAALQSPHGPDVIQLPWDWPHRHAAALLEVDDVVEAMSWSQGDLHDVFGASARVAGRWLAVPHALRTTAVAYRRSWYAEAGAGAFPRTWDEWLSRGRKLKARGVPVGQTLAAGSADAAAFAYPLLWAFGGCEVAADGATVAIESKGTTEAVKFMRAFWSEACDAGGATWDDDGNDRAFAAGRIGATVAGPSLYLATRRRGESLARDVALAPLPAGPVAQAALHLPEQHGVARSSRHPDLAKAFLLWLQTLEFHGPWLEAQQGVCVGPGTAWEASALWNRLDGSLRIMKAAGRSARTPGHPGPASHATAEAHRRAIVVQMFARVVRGLDAGAAVRWAGAELRAIHAVPDRPAR